MKLSILDGTFSICRLPPEEPFPGWVNENYFWSMTKTDTELSVVCYEKSVPSSVKAERDWKVIKVQGPLDFSLTGILASIAEPLSKAKISIFAISTFETDYILVKAIDLDLTKKALIKSGFSFQ